MLSWGDKSISDGSARWRCLGTVGEQLEASVCGDCRFVVPG